MLTSYKSTGVSFKWVTLWSTDYEISNNVHSYEFFRKRRLRHVTLERLERQDAVLFLEVLCSVPLGIGFTGSQQLHNNQLWIRLTWRDAGTTTGIIDSISFVIVFSKPKNKLRNIGLCIVLFNYLDFKFIL